MQVIKNHTLLENYFTECLYYVILNFISLGFSLYYLFINKSVILLIIFKTIFFSSTETQLINPLLFPYLEYINFSQIYTFLGRYFIIICLFFYTPIWIYQLKLLLISACSSNFLNKTLSVYSYMIYNLWFYYLNSVFFSIYVYLILYLQTLFSIFGHSNFLGLTIDYIISLDHIQTLHIFYISVISVITIIIIIATFLHLQKNKKFYWFYKNYVNLITQVFLIAWIFLISLNFIITPPDFSLHVFNIIVITKVLMLLNIYFYTVAVPIMGYPKKE